VPNPSRQETGKLTYQTVRMGARWPDEEATPRPRELVDATQIVWPIDTEVEEQPQLGGRWKSRENQTKLAASPGLGESWRIRGAGPLEPRRGESHGESRRVKARQRRRRDDAMRDEATKGSIRDDLGDVV
jgi:hypothetical protein